MSEGESVRFGDVVREIRTAEHDPEGAGIDRVVGLEHLDPMSLRITRWGDVANGTTFTRRFEAGQMLFGKRRCYQKKAAVPDFGGICSGDIIVMKAIEDLLLPELLPFLVQSEAFFDWAEMTSAGSLSPRTKFKLLADFRFNLPTLDRQREILKVLQALEDSLRATEDALDSAEQLKRSLMATLLTKGIGHTKFKKTEIGKIPETWEIRNLGSLVRPNGLQTGPFGSQLHANEYTESGVAVVMPKDLDTGLLRLGEAARIPEDVAERISKHLCEEDDILFSRRGDVSLCGLVQASDLPCICGTGCIRARLDSAVIHPAYAAEWLQHPWCRRWLENNAVGLTMLNLNTTILAGLPFIVPHLADQHKSLKQFNGLKLEIAFLRDKRAAQIALKRTTTAATLTP